jgi:hypothetical protein
MTLKQLITSLILCLALGQGYAWAEETPVSATDDVTEDTSTVSHVEAWEDETSQDDDWTWFGMGYESRKSSMEVQGPGNPAAPSSGRGGSGGRK